jgi:hypothetical protein
MSERSPSDALRVAMLARVVFPLHGFGGIERHVFHLTTHLARLGVRVTLYVQTSGAPSHNHAADRANPYADVLPGIERVITLRYDYTSPLLRPNSIPGRQINYPWYSWRLGRMVGNRCTTRRIRCGSCPGIMRVRLRLDPRPRPAVASPAVHRQPAWTGRVSHTRLAQVAGICALSRALLLRRTLCRPRHRHRCLYTGRSATLSGRRSGAGCGYSQRHRRRRMPGAGQRRRACAVARTAAPR